MTRCNKNAILIIGNNKGDKKMKLTSKGRYAVRALIDLTFNSNGKPVRLQDISSRQSISTRYLEQLFRKLRIGKVVKSVRGPNGGYVLSRPMNTITIKDVLECVGENTDLAVDISGNLSSGEKFTTDELVLTRDFFENLGFIMQDYLTNTTLGDLKNNLK